MKKIILQSSISAATFTESVPLALGDIKNVGIDFDISGSDVEGTITIQVKGHNDAAWKEIDESEISVTASASQFYNICGASYDFLRMAWSYTSGTGNIEVYATLKENQIIGA